MFRIEPCSHSIILVDRILRQQKDARLAAESDRMAKEKEKAARLPPPPLPPANTRPTVKDHLDSNPTDQLESKPPPSTNLAGHLQSFRRKIGSMASSSEKPLQPSIPTTDGSSQTAGAVNNLIKTLAISLSDDYRSNKYAKSIRFNHPNKQLR